MRPNCSRFCGRLLLCLLLILGSVIRLPAQTGTGTLRGQVRDPSGAIVVGATVTATGPSGQTATAKSGSDGNYEIRNLAPGKYSVQVDLNGFASYRNDAVQISAGEAHALNASLALQTQTEQVTVSGETVGVDVSASANANAVILTEKELEALPDDPDELQSDLEALAGPSVGPNGGQLYIDGFTAGQLPPKSSIREIRINQNPFSAEYDKAGYGRIEIFTKPGTDKWHGQAFVNENASVFNTGSPFALPNTPGYDSTQVSGNFGGPLSKKASFFLNLDTRKIDDTSIVNAYTITSLGQEVPYDTSLRNPRSRINISPRLDYQLGKTNTLSVRYQFYRDNQTNDGITGLDFPSLAYNVLTTEQTLQVSDTQSIGSKMINETRFQFLRDDSNQVPQSTLPVVSVPGSFAQGGNSGQNEIDHTNHYELQNYDSIALAKHFIIFGGRLRMQTDSNYSTAGMNGSFTFRSLTTYLNNQPNQFTITTGSPYANVEMTDIGLYVEDNWAARRNLNVSYGIRWESQNHIHDHDDWAPRVGISYGLGSGKTPKTVLRAGFGIFYDRFTENLILQQERLNDVTQQEFVVTNPTSYPSFPPLNFPTFYQASPTLHAPFTTQLGFSVDRQLTKIAKMSVSYLHSDGFDQLVSNNINAPLPGTYIPGVATSGVRPNGLLENIYQYQSDAVFKQNQFIANVNIRAGTKILLNGYYTLNYANSDTAGATTFQSNPYNLSADYGRAAFAIRNRVFLGGTITLPYAIVASPFVLVSSGTPYSTTINQDLIGSSILNQRPAFCTAPNSSSDCIDTAYGNFDTVPSPGEQIVPINYLTGPTHFTFNLRLSKTIGFGGLAEGPTGRPRAGGGGAPGGGGGARGGNPFGARGGGGGNNAASHRYNVTFSVNARNLFNYVNLATPIGNVNSPLFGRSDALVGGAFSTQSADRQIFLQTTFAF